MDLYKANKGSGRRNFKDMPLVMAVKNQQKGTTLIVAVIGSCNSDNILKSDFGQRYKKVVEEMGIKV